MARKFLDYTGVSYLWQKIVAELNKKANNQDLATVATSGSYNDLINKPAIPTKVSDLQDDSGHYIKPVGGIPAQDLAETYLTQHQDISGKANSADLAAVATSGNYNDLLNIPTNVSTFTNDAGYLTQHQDISGKANNADLATVATSGSYNDLSNKPFIPSAVSDLTDDSGHYTKPVGGIPAADLAETYLTSFTETDPTVPSWAKAAQKPSYTAAEVGAPTVQEMNTAIGTAIGNINSFDMAVVQELPSQDISTHTIYLVPKTGETNDVYDEYVYINSNWEMVGNTQIDLSNYATKSEIPSVPVQDVQINGSSVLNNGIANLPVASNSTLGLVKVNANAGISIYPSNAGNLSNCLGIFTATDTEIKSGQINTHPIAPAYQHYAVFYGLAKTAGDTTQSQSNNTVGTYTTEAKAAIRSMIGAAASADVTVQDVQVNGTSILENGIANIPRAGYANGIFGVVSIGSFTASGLEFSQTGLLRLSGVSDEYVKAGQNYRMAITPSHQHVATFYGLAKAAGADMKDIASTTVGIYPAAQKAAIQNMLGISNLLAPIETVVASKAYGIGEIFTSNGKLYKATAAIAASDTIVTQDAGETVSGSNAEEVKVSEYAVRDVQVNGSSIISSGVANIPKASVNDFGAVLIYPNNGVNIDSVGRLIIYASSNDLNKTGSNQNRPIVPAIQHSSVFYGLAKAAGDITQSQSDNAVGTYTSEAKAAIQSMLGINYTLTVTVLTQDNVTVTEQTVTVREGGSEGQIYATATYSGQPVSFALPTGFSYYVSVSDTLAHHFNPTTASGIITNTDAAATLTYSDFSTIQTAADIKAALNAGLDLTDLVGEQVSCTWNGSTLVWDVVDYNNNTITLLTHDTLPTQLQFEPQQALMWCENGLAAGSYCFTHSSSTYYFTLTTAIPAEGQLRATTSAFQTYASMEATSTLETGTVSTTEISGATSLGTTASGNLNHMDRVNYGSNNYKESGLFQWLNSTAAANTPMLRITKFSRPYSVNVPGFLGALDSSFVAAIDDTTWFCSTNNIYECPSSLGGTVAKQNAYTVTAKIGLASEMEIFGSYGGTTDGSTIYDLYSGADADDRKKYQPGTSTVRSWWLRSPGWSSAGIERRVLTSGAAIGVDAYYSSGVVPAVRISKDVSSS